MKLTYYLDLEKLCNANLTQIETFFRFVNDVFMESCALKANEIAEYFIRDDDSCFMNHNHTSGKALYEIIFDSSKGDVFNRIIPVIWHCFEAQDSSFIKRLSMGKISPNCETLHPNAKLTIKSRPREVWHIETKNHYYDFRYHQIREKILSSDCENFFPLFIPKIILTKKALASYKKMGRGDKNSIISNLKKLNGYVDEYWRSGDFQIDDFSKSTGVRASDESESTKNDPKLKNLRYFSIDGIGSVYCFLHIKVSNTYRIHFYTDKNSRIVHVAYIGKHLKTATNR